MLVVASTTIVDVTGALDGAAVVVVVDVVGVVVLDVVAVVVVVVVAVVVVVVVVAAAKDNGTNTSWSGSTAPLPGYTAIPYRPLPSTSATSRSTTKLPSGSSSTISGLVPVGFRYSNPSLGSAQACATTCRAEEGAPSEGFHGAAKRPKVTYTPLGSPASGGRVPTCPPGSNPYPRTVTTEPVGSSPLVADTSTPAEPSADGSAPAEPGSATAVGSTTASAARTAVAIARTRRARGGCRAGFPGRVGVS